MQKKAKKRSRRKKCFLDKEAFYQGRKWNVIGAFHEENNESLYLITRKNKALFAVGSDLRGV